jgi:hypothetical protein
MTGRAVLRPGGSRHALTAAAAATPDGGVRFGMVSCPFHDGAPARGTRRAHGADGDLV